MIRREGGILYVEGAMTHRETPELERLGLAEIAAGGVCAVDLSFVTTADSSGLALLFAWLRVAQDGLEIRSLPETLVDLSRLYGAEPLLQRFVPAGA